MTTPTDETTPTEILFAVCRVLDFADLEIEVLKDGKPFQMRKQPLFVGSLDGSPAPPSFLPVFKTIQDAMAWSEDGRFQIMRVTLTPHVHAEG